jgi:hypothetical protein
MPKLYEYFGLIVLFYSNEHEPVHVHGKYQGCESRAEFIIENRLLRSSQTDSGQANYAPVAVRLAEGAVVEIVSAAFLNGYQLQITFSDGHIQAVDFEPFLQSSLNPLIRKYLDPELFQQFSIENGDLQWNDYDLCFPIADLYENNLRRWRDEL